MKYETYNISIEQNMPYLSYIATATTLKEQEVKCDFDRPPVGSKKVSKTATSSITGLINICI